MFKHYLELGILDKNGHNLLGFVNLGDINEQLQELEKDTQSAQQPHKNLATHMLTVMARGIFLKLEFPFDIVYIFMNLHFIKNHYYIPEMWYV